MKLLLTSAGLTNDSLKKAFLDLLEKPVKSCKILYVITAANAEEGDKWWLVKDINTIADLHPESFDIIDFVGLPKELWLPRMQEADVLIFGGGNTLHLLKSIKDAGLGKYLQDWLKTKVYMGISAGSIVMGPTLEAGTKRDLYSEKYHVYVTDKALGVVPFHVRPHVGNNYFPNATLDNMNKLAHELQATVYALDDASGILVKDSQVEVISEGVWQECKPPDRFAE